MNNRLAICISLTCLIVSCSLKQPFVNSQNQSGIQSSSTNQLENPEGEKLLEKLPRPSEKIKLPNVKDFGVVHVFRKSNQENERGGRVRSFYEAEILIGLNSEPQVGEKVTIIPLNVDLEPFQLSISRTEKKEEACTENNKQYYWDTEIEKLTSKEILELEPLTDRADEFPFDVAVIYPSVNFAKNIENSALSKDTIPRGVAINTIVAAIDLDNDKNPDLLKIVFCCSNDSIAPNDKCDYICEKSFKKISGKWKMVDSAMPC